MDHSCMSEKIGKLIASRLQEMDKGQAWLAEEAKVSVNAVSKWTRSGKISRDRVPKVAQLLGVSVEELVTGEAREMAPRPAIGKLERLDADEALLLEMFRECRQGERELLLSHAKLLAGAAGAVDIFRDRLNQSKPG